jgi:hypothetical protein
MEQIILVKEETLYEVNKNLEDGWAVKMIVPMHQPIATGGRWCEKGMYGAYVVLQKGE